VVEILQALLLLRQLRYNMSRKTIFPNSTDKGRQARAQKKHLSPLEQKLAAEKKKGMTGALQDASEENRRHRETDAANEARNYN
jgi:hypothetical protein